MRVIGRFKLYFNRHGAAPLVWCVAPDDGTWELSIAGFHVADTSLATVYAPKATPDDEDGKPSAYLVVEGEMTVQKGFAYFGPIKTRVG